MNAPGPFPSHDRVLRYGLFGLVLETEIPLPELNAACDGPSDPVKIALGKVPRVSPRAEPPGPLTVTPEGITLEVRDVARFLVRDGRSILVDPDPAASDRNVRLYLLGSAMGLLLHIRGILPLHANAIDVGGEAVAFLGHSGAGKSTLAAAFHDRGHRILSDDVCVVAPAAGGFIAQPGIPRLRLWRDAIERTGRVADAYERAFDALDKFTVQTDEAARSGALPLKAIYLLVQLPEAEAGFDIRSLSRAEAFQALLENTYRGAFVPLVGKAGPHFEACLRLCRAVPVFGFARPWDPGRIDQATDMIEEHLRSLAPPLPAQPRAGVANPLNQPQTG